MNLYDVINNKNNVLNELAKLSNNDFGLVNERKYPIHDKFHISKAIQLFRFCNEENKPELAMNIYKKAILNEVEIPENSQVFNYLPDDKKKIVMEGKIKLSENVMMGDFPLIRTLSLATSDQKKFRDKYKGLYILSEHPNYDGYMFVDNNDDLVGYIQGNKKTSFINNLLIQPQYRNQGLGSKLVDLAMNKGLNKVRLRNDNKELLNFFLKNNFSIKNKTGNNLFLSRNISLNETLETRITRPMSNFQKEVTLYHSSLKELKIIEPMTNNIGTKLSDIRKSSFWTRDMLCGHIFGFVSLVVKLYGKDSCGFLNNQIYVASDCYDKIKVSNEKFYIYEVTVPWSIVGRGHNSEIDEYTLDRPVKPNKIHIFKLKDFIKNKNIKICEREEIRKFYNDFMESIKKTGRVPKDVDRSTFLDRLVYYDREETNRRRKELKKV